MIRLVASDYGIDIERQAKLLEDISSINGDYSYSFELPNTQENRQLLGIKTVNSTAYWNTTIPAELTNEGGQALYSGFLQIESETRDNISVSFYSGNTDWFNILNVNLLDLNYAQLEKDWTTANIVSSWSQDNGIVFPVVNRGGLLTRKSPNYYIDDFQPFLYVKDAIRVIFANFGIKLEGDLLNDPLYNSLITTNNSAKGAQRRVDEQKVKAGKPSSQSITKSSETKITFTDTDEPYFNSPQANWSTANSQYTFTESVRRFNVDVNIKLSNNNAAFLTYVRLYYNSTLVHEIRTFQLSPNVISFNIGSNEFNKAVLYGGAGVGDTLEVRLIWYGLSTTLNVLADSFFSVTPTKFYKTEATQCLPDKKASEFVRDVFAIFNPIVSYDAKRKVLTVKKLDSVIREEPVDISEHVQRDSIEYLEYIQNYSQNNLLVYQDQTFEEINKYNIFDRIPYGQGNIPVINDFLDKENELLSVDFIATWQQDVDFLGSLPRLEYVDMVETNDTRSVTSVTDNGGTARFNFSGAGVGVQLVRVSNSSVDSYNGDYKSNLNTSGYTELEGVLFDGNATCTITVLDWEDKDNDDQCILINKPSVKLTDIGYGGTIEAPNGSDVSTIALAYFYYPDRGTRFSRFRGVGLPFNSVDNNQQGLIDAYWQSAERLLSNGIMVRYTAFLPELLFRKLDFLRPVRIVTPEENMIYLVNRITGYKGSSYPCELELVNIQNVQLATIVQTSSEEPPAPPPDPVEVTRYYLADLYECSTCNLLLTGQVVEATSVKQLTLNRWYATGNESVYIYALAMSGPPDYVLINNLQYPNCFTVPCIAP
jgi:hypothetical protein